MPFFKHKPVIVEAYQFDGSPESAEIIKRWTGGKVTGIFDEDAQAYLMVDGPGEDQLALVGYWIVKGVDGTFHPNKPETFGFSFEAIDG